MEDASEWLRRAGATARLGISERTLDNRLRAANFRKRWNGPHVEVLVPRLVEDVQATKALAVVDAYRADLALQLTPLLAQVERLARENGELQHRLRQAEAQLAELSAEGLQRAEDASETCAAEAPRAWWARWRWWRR